MAVTLQSSNSINYTDVDYTVGIDITKPTGLAVGDLMLAFVTVVTASVQSEVVEPSGWTTIDSGVTQDAGIGWRSMYKVAVSGDVAASTFNFTHGVAGSRYMGGGLSRITGYVLDFTVKSKQDIVGGTVFGSADLTPAYANSLLLFFSIHRASGDTGAVDSQACATSNPSWAEAYDFGSTSPNPDAAVALAYANRPEVTSTGDFSLSPSGNYTGHFISISPQENVTVSPSVVTATLFVQAPAVTGGVGISPTVITMTLSIQTPTVTLEASDWVNTDKNSSSFSNQTKHSASWSNLSKNSANWVNENKT